MKLDYEILWFEDQFNEISPMVDRLSKFIRSKGFVPKITKKSSITEEDVYSLGEELEQNNRYDLIIFDFDMGRNEQSGVEIAEILRMTIYTDMVFYSGKKPDEINKIIYESAIQGVFVIHKTNLFDEMSPLLADHMKKISSLNGARGMIMSEWSSIEIELRQHLKGRVESLEPEAREVQERKILQRLLRQAEERVKKLKENPDVYSVLVNSIKCDFSIIRRSLKSLEAGGSIFEDDSFVHNMQNERNLLAHNKHKFTADGSLLISDPAGREVTYNLSEFERLRKRLIDLKDKVEKL